MKASLARVVREHFGALVVGPLLGFALDPGAETPEGSDVYRKGQGTLACFVTIGCDPNADRFDIRIAWSKDGKYPAYSLGGRPSDRKRDHLRFQLRRLVDRGPLVRPWAVDDASAVAQVEDAVAMLMSHGIPYLEEVAAELVASR